jgi:UDP-N-acetylglucosamine 4,6-dehydratase (inverting)
MIEKDKLKEMIDGRTILVTGGTGSFGNEFTRVLLEEFEPKAIRIFSRDEKKQYDMERKFNDERLRFLIGDVRDSVRLIRAMNGVDIVVHAAALKQVPSCEYNPIEAIMTNVSGSINVINAAIDNCVKKTMLISTDKAVFPVNLYGATKMTAEKLFVQANSYAKTGTNFSCVRYGNVIGSRGSVIPLFLEQKEKGEITITDERMTRFWIKLYDGVMLVLNSLYNMTGGEIFIPKISSMKITELADIIAPNIKKKIIGIRPGERLHEILLTEDEARHSRDYGDHYTIFPEHHYWKDRVITGGKPLPEGFVYNSQNKDSSIKRTDLEKLIKEFI